MSELTPQPTPDPASVYNAIDTMSSQLVQKVQETEQLRKNLNVLVALRDAFESSKGNIIVQNIIKAYTAQKGMDPESLNPLFV